MTFKKRGYFFVLDAAIGLLIIIIGVLLVTSHYFDVPQPAQVGLLADDLLSFLSNKKIKDLNNPYAGIGGQLWQQGDITNGDNTLLQQIGEFYSTNKLSIAEKFIENISIVPFQFRYEVWMNSVLIYPLSPSTAHSKSKNSTNILLTSKKITFGIINKTTSNVWGPYSAEVYVWER